MSDELFDLREFPEIHGFRTKTRIVWVNVLTYIVAFGVGWTLGRLMGLPISASCVLGGVFDVTVLSMLVSR